MLTTTNTDWSVTWRSVRASHEWQPAQPLQPAARSQTMKPLLCVGVLVGLAVSGILSRAANAAMRFGAPVSIGAPVAGMTDADVFFSADGRALLTWNARVRLT